MNEQNPKRLGEKWVQCPKCKNAVYTPNLTAYSCPYCSIEVDREQNTEKEKEKPMSLRSAIWVIVKTLIFVAIFIVSLLWVLDTMSIIEMHWGTEPDTLLILHRAWIQ